MTRNTVSAVLAALFLSTAVDGYAVDGPEKSWLCSSHGHERAIELHERYVERRDDELSCWVVYTTEGASEVLWQAKNNPDYCQPKALSLVARLESAGFGCTMSHPENRPNTRSDSRPAATDDSEVVMPTLPRAARSDESAVTETDFRRLLSKHYEEDYLEAMLAALPKGFSPRLDMDAISMGRQEYLHVGPPDHFVKTLSDGSYLLVNTLLFEQGPASSYVNLGFQVENKRYHFLGYATTQPVTEFEVLDAGPESIVLSVIPMTEIDCTPARRTQVLAWGGKLSRQDPHTAELSMSGDDECGDAPP